MGTSRTEGSYTFPITNRILGFVAFIAILPATVMMISFFMEGALPPWPPFLIFTSSMLIFGIKRKLVFDDEAKQMRRHTSVWGGTVQNSIISSSDIKYLYLRSHQYEKTEWKKNYHTDEYEIHSTGETGTAWHLVMVCKDSRYRLSWKENTPQELGKLGKMLAKRLDVAYYRANKKLPGFQPTKSFSFARVFWSGVVLLVLYAFVDTYRENKEIEILSEEKAAAMGLSKVPDLLDKSLKTGSEVMIFCPVYYNWRWGTVLESSASGEVQVQRIDTGRWSCLHCSRFIPCPL